MAPVGQSEHDVVEKNIKDVINDIFQLMVQVSAYDHTSKPSSEVLENTIKNLDLSLNRVHTTSTSQIHLPSIPPELIQYVDNGRNPDIYSRELVEAARKSNQIMKGKTEAFADFRDVLAQEIRRAMPELAEDVDRAVVATGGKGEGREG